MGLFSFIKYQILQKAFIIDFFSVESLRGAFFLLFIYIFNIKSICVIGEKWQRFRMFRSAVIVRVLLDIYKDIWDSLKNKTLSIFTFPFSFKIRNIFCFVYHLSVLPRHNSTHDFLRSFYIHDISSSKVFFVLFILRIHNQNKRLFSKYVVSIFSIINFLECSSDVLGKIRRNNSYCKKKSISKICYRSVFDYIKIFLRQING